jgi:hypothetical protein
MDAKAKQFEKERESKERERKRQPEKIQRKTAKKRI